MANTSVTILGIDFSTDPKKTGLALGVFESNQVCFKRTGRLHFDSSIVDEACAESSVLIAIDAPLGWPHLLGLSLAPHVAGSVICTPPDCMFQRATDRFIEERVKKPLDVGADKIARTAHAALQFLGEHRVRTGKAWPLAWDRAEMQNNHAVIEVYPAATLKAYEMRDDGYKEGNRTERSELVEQLKRKSWIVFGDKNLSNSLCENDDVLDAAVCVLAARDFLMGRAMKPPHTLRFQARREGWIWAKGPNT